MCNQEQDNDAILPVGWHVFSPQFIRGYKIEIIIIIHTVLSRHKVVTSEAVRFQSAAFALMAARTGMLTSEDTGCRDFLLFCCSTAANSRYTAFCNNCNLVLSVHVTNM